MAIDYKNKVLLGGVAVLGLGALAVGGFALANPSGGDLASKVSAHFPNTPITSANCDRGPGQLCEVVAGQNVFYVTPDARYAIVGAVLDLENKVDLTDQRLRELAAVSDTEARIAGGRPAAGSAGAPAAGLPDEGSVVNVTLPRANAIVHNPGAPTKVTIFTDVNCGWCQRLHNDLTGVSDIEVTEYLIAFMGADSTEKAKLALCASDRVAGVASVYRGGEVRVRGDCEAEAALVAQNTAFAQQNGITGTPTIVRADGQANSGWMPLDELRAFIAGAA